MKAPLRFSELIDTALLGGLALSTMASAAPMVFNLRDTVAIAEIESGTITRGGITATLTPGVQGSIGVLNQTAAGLGVNAISSSDVADQLDNGGGTESISIMFNVDVTWQLLELSLFSSGEQASLTIGSHSPISLTPFAADPDAYNFSSNNLVLAGQIVILQHGGGNGFSFDAFAVERWAPPATGVVSNIHAVQRLGTQHVDIYYDLSASTAAVEVSVLVSADGGTKWDIPAYTFTGAYGPGVTAGNGRWLTWNAGHDWPGKFSTTMRFRITADDSTASVPPGFAFIPTGSFQMGDALDGNGNSDAVPVHSVNVSAFYMQTTEVTKVQWDATYSYATANGYAFYNPGSGKTPNHPVQTVSWRDVVRWCNARSQQESLQPCYSVGGATYKTDGPGEVACDFTRNGYRLPTEAEWEKAARGGQSGRRFPWGDEIEHSLANYFSTSGDLHDISPTRGYHPAYNDNVYPYIDRCISPGILFA